MYLQRKITNVNTKELANGIIIMTWKKYNDNLDNIVLNILDDERANEGMGKLMTFGTLLFLLGTSGMVEAATFKHNLEKEVRAKQEIQGKLVPVSLTKKDIAKAVEQSIKDDAKDMVGSWEKAKATNVLARTLYMEARGEGVVGMKMVMTVIWNRAGGKAENLSDVCLKPKQFSCWNNISNKSPSTYKIEFPKGATSSGSDKDSWEICTRLAQMAFNGTFKPVNEHWNAYYNPDKANPSWASQLMNPKTIGHHKVGELKDQTRKANKLKGKNIAEKPTSTIDYTVKKGDTLYTIAGKDMKKVQKLKELNNLKSNVIRPGQTLKIPA